MLKEWFDSFGCKNAEDVARAKREMLQYIVLGALSRTDFFVHASFFGGTALRILYNLPRFSEDLDFSLNSSDKTFSINTYLKAIIDECEMHGLRVTATLKEKVNPNDIESAFLKDETIWADLNIEDFTGGFVLHKMKIKIEIEKNAPQDVKTEQRLLLRPFSFYIKAYTLPFLFAGKMHAVLFRNWKNRVKGRDWYDLEWYIKNGTHLNLKHLELRAIQSAHLPKGDNLNAKEFLELLNTRIKEVDFKSARDDISNFIFNSNKLDIWGKQYFLDLVKQIKIEI